MTVVVADTSPLNYLALIEPIDILPRLYGTVVIPQEVLSELTSPAAPREVREWARRFPIGSTFDPFRSATIRRYRISTQENGAPLRSRSPRRTRCY